MRVLGIDVGGSGIKGAPVDVSTGQLVGDRQRLKTPQPATPESVAAMIAELIAHFEWSGPVGVGFPAAITDQIVRTASNIDESWIGVDIVELLEGHASCEFTVANDADVAGIAEARFGAARGVSGSCLVLTIGTGIGSALMIDGRLVPNTEFGHLEIGGRIAERLASAAVRERKKLSWRKWARRLDHVLKAYERLLWPSRIVVGGGVSKRSERFLPHLTVQTEVVPAELRNLAGIIGAACLAADRASAVPSANPALTAWSD